MSSSTRDRSPAFGLRSAGGFRPQRWTRSFVFLGALFAACASLPGREPYAIGRYSAQKIIELRRDRTSADSEVALMTLTFVSRDWEVV